MGSERFAQCSVMSRSTASNYLILGIKNDLLIQVNQCQGAALQHAFAPLLSCTRGQHATVLLTCMYAHYGKKACIRQWGHTTTNDCVFVAAALSRTIALSDSSRGDITLTWGLLVLAKMYPNIVTLSVCLSAPPSV